uniref:PI3K/PI4K domain-containing protein n=1 Tax=Heterorhabditis bacteriophora TaxID=37862 RepID=A0A1I7W8D7_HETBA
MHILCASSKQADLETKDVYVFSLDFLLMAALNGNLAEHIQSQLSYPQHQNGTDTKPFVPSYKRMAQIRHFSAEPSSVSRRSYVNIVEIATSTRYPELSYLEIVEQLTQVESLCQELRRCIMPDVSSVQQALSSQCLLFETTDLTIDVRFWNINVLSCYIYCICSSFLK